ncbi:MAG: DNA gyrase subunit A, partial [Mangrovimonas sp.]|nr:DNA gyrase subunit A [Mangrovimonas sp.]
EGISDLRDESDRDGLRVVIELKRNENAAVLLNQLYKHTQMQTTFGVIMLALVGNRPEVLTLKQILAAFLEHRKEVVIRRTAYDLRKAEERAHILEGLRRALEFLDEVIALIRGASSPETARQGLMSQFTLSEVQATAILEMRLQRLTQLEQDKLTQEYNELVSRIAHLRTILASDAMVRQIVKQELVEIKEQY